MAASHRDQPLDSLPCAHTSLTRPRALALTRMPCRLRQGPRPPSWCVAPLSLEHTVHKLTRRPLAELRPAINSQIAVELRSLLPKNPSANPSNLAHLPPPRPLPSSSDHPLLAAELSRVESKRPLRDGEGLDTSRYAMPFPDEASLDSVEAWERAYESSLAQLEHQRLRSLNGSLLQQLGGNKWRVENFALENAIQRVDGEGEGVKVQVEEVNRRRKADQEKAGETLSRLEKRWTELVSSGVQLEIGSVALCVPLSPRHLSPSHARSLTSIFLACLQRGAAGRAARTACGPAAASGSGVAVDRARGCNSCRACTLSRSLHDREHTPAAHMRVAGRYIIRKRESARLLPPPPGSSV